MKKITSVLLAFVVVISACAISVSADAAKLKKGKVYTSASGKYKYALSTYRTYGECCVEESITSKKDIKIVAYKGKKLSGTYRVPNKIDGHYVTSIGKNAYKGQGFTKLILGKMISDIREKAFYKCKKLVTVSANNLTDIHAKAFYGCKKLKTFSHKSDDLRIDDMAFCNCPSLKRFYACTMYMLNKNCLGFKTDKNGRFKKVKGFSLNMDYNWTHALSSAERYAYGHNILVYFSFKDDSLYNTYEIQPGLTFIPVYGKNRLTSVKCTDKKILKVTKTGRVQALQDGRATISGKLPNGKTVKRKFLLDDLTCELPDVSYEDDWEWAFGPYGGSYKIKVGKTRTLYTVGKVAGIDNILKSSKKAKFISGKNSRKIVIKGLKKGKTRLYVRINGVVTRSIDITVI